ncbi:MAG: hypothetical protein M1294_13095 [Firmicutes bacterium]|nr:hypothetical protein [Bacillota bacterium]
MTASIATRLKDRYSVPLVSHVRFLDFDDAEACWGAAIEPNRILERERQGLEASDAIVVSTKHLRDLVSGRYPHLTDKISIMPLGIPYGQYFPGPSASKVSAFRNKVAAPNERVVLFSGRIARVNGIDILIDAMPQILLRCPLRFIPVFCSVATHTPIWRAMAQKSPRSATTSGVPLPSLLRCPGSLEGQRFKDNGKRIFPQ